MEHFIGTGTNIEVNWVVHYSVESWFIILDGSLEFETRAPFRSWRHLLFPNVVTLNPSSLPSLVDSPATEPNWLADKMTTPRLPFTWLRLVLSSSWTRSRLSHVESSAHPKFLCACLQCINSKKALTREPRRGQYLSCYPRKEG